MSDGQTATLPEVKTPIPGPKSELLLTRYVECFGSKRVPRFAMEKAYGCIVEDVDGNKFLDLAQALCISGQSIPEMIEASIAQLRKTIPRGQASPPLIEFTEKLLCKLPGELGQGRVSHVVSGTDTVALAAQLSRAYTKRPIILSYHDSHHGFIGTPFELSGDPGLKRIWRAKISDVAYIPYPECYRCPFKMEQQDCDLLCLSYLENTLETVVLPDQVAGLIIEPILVNGGMYVPPADYMKGLYDICQSKGIQLIDDEFYCGVARSGRFLAIDHWSIIPDILCIGKGLGGGFPLSTVVTKREITDEIQEGVKFSGSFAANLVACAAGIENLAYIERERLCDNALKVGKYLMDAFKDISDRKRSIGDVRGLGLLIGIDVVKDKRSKKPDTDYANEIVHRALNNGLILRSRGRYGNVLLLSPPLTLSREQAQKAVEILDLLIK